MPYLILIIGIVIGIFALYRFLIKATPKQIRQLFLITIITFFSAIMLFFALSGRIIISIGLLLLAIPFIISYFRGKQKAKNSKKKKDNNKNEGEDK